jgi:hypothetical protein
VFRAVGNDVVSSAQSKCIDAGVEHGGTGLSWAELESMVGVGE